MLLLSFLLACGDPDPDSSDTAAAIDACAPSEAQANATVFELIEEGGDPDCGAEIYAGACASCHAEDGSGTSDQTDLRMHVPTMSDVELIGVIVAGSDEMPPSGLAPFDTAQVVAWLRVSFGEGPSR